MPRLKGVAGAINGLLLLMSKLALLLAASLATGIAQEAKGVPPVIAGAAVS
jgi:hypothetical protein